MNIINHTSIPFENTNQFSQLVLDFLKNDESLSLLHHGELTIENIKSQIDRRNQSKIDRSLLVKTLTHQYQNISLNDITQTHISLLNEHNTFTICTAHQPCVMLGPLYTIYKTIHTIHLALTCKKYLPQYHFVPVFYIGSEDNDLDEIGTVHVNNTTYQWQTQQRGACGRMLTHDMETMIQKICSSIDESLPFKREIENYIHTAYQSGLTLSKATRFLLHQLFKKWGLVIIDGDDKELKKSFLPVIKNELLESNIHKVLQTDKTVLNEKYKTQAHVREINLFYLAPNERLRIIRKNEATWHTEHNEYQWEKETLIQEVNKYPERFSPNVITRPMYQESILPNIIFVGGGGEISYWLQLKKAFDYYNIPYPLLKLRNSWHISSNLIKSDMEKFTLSYQDLFMHIDKVLRNYFIQISDMKTLLREKENIHIALQKIQNSGEHIHINLIQSTKAHSKKIENILLRLETKYINHLKKKYPNDVTALKKIQSTFLPHQILQERYDNFIPYYTERGEEWIDTLLNNCNEFYTEFIIQTTA